MTMDEVLFIGRNAMIVTLLVSAPVAIPLMLLLAAGIAANITQFGFVFSVKAVQPLVQAGYEAVVLTSAQVRRFFRRMVETQLPKVVVLS